MANSIINMSDKLISYEFNALGGTVRVVQSGKVVLVTLISIIQNGPLTDGTLTLPTPATEYLDFTISQRTTITGYVDYNAGNGFNVSGVSTDSYGSFTYIAQ
jgi:hypothetical protein